MSEPLNDNQNNKEDNSQGLSNRVNKDPSRTLVEA